MELRPYQNECVKRIHEEFATNKSTLAVLPTGTGKTIMFGGLCSSWRGSDYGTGDRILIVSHRRELVNQAAEKVALVTGEQVGIEMASEYSSEGMFPQRIVSASKDSLTVDRMARFKASGFGLVIVDEGHHFAKKNLTYTRVVDYFRAGNPELRLLGVTATPDRADEAALGETFESVAYDYELQDAIKDGWLSPIRQEMIVLDGFDLSQITTHGRDFVESQLEGLLDHESIAAQIARPAFDMSNGQPTLIFASGTKHAHHLAVALNAIKANCAVALYSEGVIHSDIPSISSDQRAYEFERFRRGDFQFLVNYSLFTEGTDLPSVGCVVVARPTKSRALYAQMVGRGTRLLPDVVEGFDDGSFWRIDNDWERRDAIAGSPKPFMTVIDLGGNAGSHKLVNAADILGGKYTDDVVQRAKAKPKKGKDVLQALEEAEEELEIEREQARQLAFKAARYKKVTINPFDMYHIRAERTPGWHIGRMASAKQLAVLERAGMPTDKITFTQASQLIGVVMDRRAKGLCTHRQAQMLMKNGVDPANVTFNDASRMISEIMASYKGGSR